MKILFDLEQLVCQMSDLSQSGQCSGMKSQHVERSVSRKKKCHCVLHRQHVTCRKSGDVSSGDSTWLRYNDIQYRHIYTQYITQIFIAWTPCVSCIFDAVDISNTLEVLVTLLNLQPDIVDLQEALQPLVFDDPSTSQPDDFWLHPCDCLPQQWGTEWPADPLSLENIPATSNGIFIPEPFPIVSGGSCAQNWKGQGGCDL